MKAWFKKVGEKCKSLWSKFTNWLKNVNWKVVYDKATTALLVLLMCSPFLILLYIVLWFVIPK